VLDGFALIIGSRCRPPGVSGFFRFLMMVDGGARADSASRGGVKDVRMVKLTGAT
jgi:hypothetical protein